MEIGTRGGGSDVLRCGHRRELPPGRCLRGQDLQGREGRRPPRPTAHQVRTGHQSQDRQSPRPHHPAVAAAPGRSNNRIVMNRRAFVTGLGAVLATPRTGGAQRSPVPRVGYVGNSSPSLEPDLVDAFRQGLREFGYAEGQNISIEYRWAEGRYERFPGLVADLVRLKVDVIVTAGTPGALAAKTATKTIPIVMTVAGDAVGTGLVDSLARPGGNVTGSTTIVQELEGKRLELLKEV